MKKTINTRTKYKIVGSDYSGQELRLAAFLSQDKTLVSNTDYNDALACVEALKTSKYTKFYSIIQLFYNKLNCFKTFFTL